MSENPNMSCPTCGEECHCRHSGFAAADWNDLEAFDISEQQFSASLETPAHFVPDAEVVPPAIAHPATGEPGVETATHLHSFLPAQQDDQSWRQELAAKLQNYRSRHSTRAPRYPSLQLKFESAEPSWTSTPAAKDPFPAMLQSTALDHIEPASVDPAPPPARRSLQPDTSARILEFPRPTAAWLDELAEPVTDRPRILEVADVEPPPPALGGISIEPIPQAEEGKRPGIEIPMISASMRRRLLAGTLDGLIVAAATTLFGYIFLQIAGGLPEFRLTAEIGIPLAIFLWIGYHYLLLIYSGTTVGLKLAGLELSRFDGSHVPRRSRRWRVFASALSAVSLGMGFLWCLIDEDQLCWHDRITHTHMAPKP